MSEPQGAIFFWKDEPHITGYLVIGDEHFELVGVRRSAIKTEFRGRQNKKLPHEQQGDLFNERGADSRK
jgi:hypothetical protein